MSDLEDIPPPASDMQERVDDLQSVVWGLATQIENITRQPTASTPQAASSVESAPAAATAPTALSPKASPAKAKAPRETGGAAAGPRQRPQPVDPDDDKDFTPIAWTDRASAAQWHELVKWVDWLRGTYDMRQEFSIAPCWPAHRGVANELAALRDAWVAALYAEYKQKDRSAMIHWHDRWLHPFLARVRLSWIGQGCQGSGENTHQSVRVPRPTNSTLIPSPGEYVTAAKD